MHNVRPQNKEILCDKKLNKNTDKPKDKTFKNIVKFKNFVKEQIDKKEDVNNDNAIEYSIRVVYELIPVNNGYNPILLYTALNKVSSFWQDELYEYLT